MLARLVPNIQKTADLVQEISISSNEQRTGSEQVSKAVIQLDQVIQQNSAASEKMTATSTELSAQAEYLKETIALLGFMGSILTYESHLEYRTPEPKYSTKKKDSTHIKKQKIEHSIKNKKSDGYAIDMGKDEGNTEYDDNEFEKY